MIRIKIGRTLIYLSIIIYILENMYYGWNETPMSRSELFFDKTVIYSLTTGLMFYISPLYSLYESAVKQHEKKQKS